MSTIKFVAPGADSAKVGVVTFANDMERDQSAGRIDYFNNYYVVVVYNPDPMSTEAEFLHGIVDLEEAMQTLRDEWEAQFQQEPELIPLRWEEGEEPGSDCVAVAFDDDTAFGYIFKRGDRYEADAFWFDDLVGACKTYGTYEEAKDHINRWWAEHPNSRPLTDADVEEELISYEDLEGLLELELTPEDLGLEGVSEEDWARYQQIMDSDATLEEIEWAMKLLEDHAKK